MKSQEKHYITRIYHKKKFCKSITFPGYYKFDHIYLAKCRRRYQKLKMSCSGSIMQNTERCPILSVNLRELEVLSAKCRGGQRSPSLVRRRGGKSKIRFSQRKLFILLPIAFNAILVQKVENGKCVARALLCRCMKTVVSLLRHNTFNPMKFYDVLTLFLFGTHWSSPRMDFCRNIQRADIDSLNQGWTYLYL